MVLRRKKRALIGNGKRIHQLKKKIAALEADRTAEKARAGELEMLFNTSADGLLIINTDFTIVQMNHTYAKIFNIPRTEALGRKCYEFADCIRCHTVDCSLAKAIRRKARFEMHVDRKTRDGNPIPCLLTVIPWRDRDGQIIGIVESYRDLSAIRQAENQLKLITDLIDQSNDAIFMTDFDTGRITYVNDRACTSLGRSSDELRHMNIMQIQKKFSDKAGMTSFFNELKQKGQMIYENHQNRKDGTSFPVEVSARYSSQGKDNFLVFIARDITERKLSEAVNFRLATVINQTDESVLITDRHALIEYANPAFERITGYCLDEVMGKNPRILQSGTHGPSFYKAMWAKLSTGKVWKGRLVNKKKDGTLFHEDASISPVLDDGGKIIHFVAVKRDISQEIEAENRLQQSQKMEAIGTLAGGIAHDFNNILSAVLGYTELALGDVEKGSPVENDLREIFTAGVRAKDLVRQILTFARQTDAETRPVQVKPIVKEVLKLLRSSIPTTIEIQQQIESDSLVMANAIQIHQILMNLCTNAAHAMNQDGGTLTVALTDILLNKELTRFHDNLKPGLYLRLAVTDTGTGIPGDIIKSIFNPYFTTKSPGEGTGMGLAMVHSIVTAHKGAVMVDSMPGKGSVFTVFLPVFKKRGELRPDQTESLPLGNERILLVDDEPPIVRMVCQILEKLGYAVTPETGSLEALDTFRSRPHDFDLVITDMTMPNMTGEKLAAKLMQIRPDIPVILCTGYSRKLPREKMVEVGIKTVLSKPILKSDLAAIVRKTLDDEIRRPLA